jgi:hypothetical protein
MGFITESQIRSACLRLAHCQAAAVDNAPSHHNGAQLEGRDSDFAGRKHSGGSGTRGPSCWSRPAGAGWWWAAVTVPLAADSDSGRGARAYPARGGLLAAAGDCWIIIMVLASEAAWLCRPGASARLPHASHGGGSWRCQWCACASGPPSPGLNRFCEAGLWDSPSRPSRGPVWPPSQASSSEVCLGGSPSCLVTLMILLVA